MEHNNPSRNPEDGSRLPIHEADFPSTPGATPLRTYSIISSTQRFSASTTSLPSLLPATGTTLILPPSQSTGSSSTSYHMTSSLIIEPPIHSGIPSGTHTSNSPSVIMQNQPRIQLHLPIAAIVGIAAGGSCVLIVSFLLFCWLRTPKRRRIPRPSLPKLENGDIDEKEDPPQESPLFGPKERLSQRQGYQPTWSWVTYPRNNTVSEKDEKAPREGTIASQSLGTAVAAPLFEAAATVDHHKTSPSIYPASGHFHTLSAPVGSLSLGAGHPSLQQVQDAINRTTSRMSTTSLASSYPKMRSAGATLTADGHDILKRQSRTLRKSRSNSMYEDRRRLSRASTCLAYEGADVTSPIPVMEFMPLDSPSIEDGHHFKAERRTRIQIPYYATGSYPRISSAVPTTYGVATRVKLGEGSIKGMSSPNSIQDTSRDKETRALTHAHGLASPYLHKYIPSPQPTLYPDDSLSIVESKRLLKQRSQKKRLSTYLGDMGQSNQVSEGRRQHLAATPTRSVVAVASGSLVSAEDIKALASGNGASSQNGVNKLMGKKSRMGSSEFEGRADDKPPRVPSPPPLPSLAQMALEHNNPDGYSNYRSPTYSIYNLYDDNRRSTFYGSKH